MAHLIDKAAVVAEIDKRIDELKGTVLEIGNQESHECDVFNDIYLYEDMLSFLGTLEVKDVDLDDEIVDYINNHYHIRFDETLERGNDPLTTIDFEEIAKHFFELGLKVNNDAVIEKACEWLKENITNNPNANSVLVRNGCVTLGMLVKDFKNYMKGE